MSRQLRHASLSTRARLKSVALFPQRGATLVELLTAIAIFSIVLLIMVGLFARFTLTQRHSIEEQALQEDLRFALEFFSREARTAFSSSFALTDSFGRSLVFRNQRGECVNYRFAGGQLQRAAARPLGAGCQAAADQSFEPLTSDRTIIDNASRFDPVAARDDNSDGQLDNQGFVTVIIRARTQKQSVPVLDLETTVASRQVVPYN